MRRLLSLLLLFALIPGSSVIGAEIGYRQAAQSDTPLFMLAVEGGIEIRDNGQLEHIALSEGAWMQAIERLGTELSAGAAASSVKSATGWVVTGTQTSKTGRTLMVTVSNGTENQLLTTPKLSLGSLAWWPLPIVQRSRLIGLVWLEGDRLDRLAVVAARWQGDRWTSPVVVSPVGVGSQAGLTATVLEDGTWLLAWTRFDGQDDEIMWASGDGTKFRRPTPLHRGNALADILPSLVAVGNTATVAWSREGQDSYLLQIAEFDGKSWNQINLAPMTAVAPQLHRRDKSVLISLWTHTGLEPRWALAKVHQHALTFIDSLAGEQSRPAVASTQTGRFVAPPKVSR